ncbi:MAG TPA: class I SAM-dependent methyltransferase [Acidimicrobiales bacterium]|nr:class I SAM-dependent methyltransferase [Acidimicrobiales bacterium]
MSDAGMVDAADARDALVERLLGATIATLELYSVYLGWRLGLYRLLAASPPLTSAELAARAAIDARYAREWLEQQAVAGFLEVSDGNGDADQRRYRLPPAYAEVLADPDSAAHVAPFAPLVVGIGGALPEVVDAYRSGAGVPFARYGRDLRDGQGAINRPAFLHDLAGWLAAIPEVDERLSAEPPARVADVGCGQGFSTLAIARAYPLVQVDGVDLDEASVADARRLADGSDVADRVRFEVRDSAGLAASGPYDLICIFEALHDMARPVAALAACRQALAPGGALLVVDERVADRFTAPGDEIERMMYGWSVSHCLPASRAEQPSAALGTVLRAGTLRRLGAEAGFAAVDVVPVENELFRFYLLHD